MITKDSQSAPDRTPSQPMRICAFGDIHMDLGRLADIAELAAADLLLITGDLTNFGGRAEAERVVAAIRAKNPALLAVAGNLDRPEVNRYLLDEGISLHGRGVVVNHLGIFGVGGSNPTPFGTPNEFSENELTRLAAEGLAATEGARCRILVSHAPPHGTKTDRLGNNSHVGSCAIRALIEEQQPELCLTGHIHEAKGVDTIGRTTIINPGMLRDGGWIDIRWDGEAITATLGDRP
ncbi:MAG: metallophosphoesterase family protein [Desulfobulbaceae bacterium]|nr:metallophosphoesterase family protein [Desulfobulbaceae bacterium]